MSIMVVGNFFEATFGTCTKKLQSDLENQMFSQTIRASGMID
jgi:hypothetical protein